MGFKKYLYICKKYLILNTKDKNQISRKEALKKMGKYAAITAVGTFIVLNPLKVQANSWGAPDNAPE